MSSRQKGLLNTPGDDVPSHPDDVRPRLLQQVPTRYLEDSHVNLHPLSELPKRGRQCSANLFWCRAWTFEWEALYAEPVMNRKESAEHLKQR